MPDETRVTGDAALLTTISEEGFPHHAFLSEDEWAEAGGRIRISLTLGSRTARNLLARPRASFLRVTSGEAAVWRLEILEPGIPMEADPRRGAFNFWILEKTIAKTPPEEKARLTGSFAFERWETPGERERRDGVKEELCR